MVRITQSLVIELSTDFSTFSTGFFLFSIAKLWKTFLLREKSFSFGFFQNENLSKN